MLTLCFYFQVHQPFRLRHYRVREIGTHAGYFDDESNETIFHKVARNCYWPAGKLLLQLLKQYPEKLQLTFSLSGTFIEQARRFDPKLLRLYQEIFKHPNAELLCETSHHSLAALGDPREFRRQVARQKAILKHYFNREPQVFRNTELIYTDTIGAMVADMGFKGCLLEGWDTVIPQGWNAHHLFAHPTRPGFKLMPKSYSLSDDIAFRFSNRGWPSWPLTAAKYQTWLGDLLDGNHEFIGLFMDYETFGEHQWADTGIFAFMEDFIHRVAHDDRFRFASASQAADLLPARVPLHVAKPLSWADSERDISAWLGNTLQEHAFERIYKLGATVRRTKDRALIEEWRKLQTSDHFYYMCIKYSHDGDVHKYFSPFESPYDAYLDYINIVEDFAVKCKNIYKHSHPEHSADKELPQGA